jgi:hypothetical protein
MTARWPPNHQDRRSRGGKVRDRTAVRKTKCLIFWNVNTKTDRPIQGGNTPAVQHECE